MKRTCEERGEGNCADRPKRGLIRYKWNRTANIQRVGTVARASARLEVYQIDRSIYSTLLDQMTAFIKLISHFNLLHTTHSAHPPCIQNHCPILYHLLVCVLTLFFISSLLTPVRTSTHHHPPPRPQPRQHHLPPLILPTPHRLYGRTIIRLRSNAVARRSQLDRFFTFPLPRRGR